MPFDLNRFRTEGLPDGGLRPTLFEVWITPPRTSPALELIRFRCMAAQVPAATVGVIDVPYFGRKIKVAGDRVFADWTVNIIEDEDMAVRAIMETWSNDINTLRSNYRIGTTPEDYKSSDAFVTQYGKRGDVLRRYRFVGIWPNNVEAINLDWDRTNAIATFATTLSFDYWELDEQRSPDVLDPGLTN